MRVMCRYDSYFLRTVLRKLVWGLLSCSLLAISCGSSRAQNVNLPLVSLPKQDRPPSIRVNSDLVLIPVTVLDDHDRNVVGLGKESFRLYDDKVEQVITRFSIEEAPISVAFLFDASGSMARKLSKAQESVSRFLYSSNSDDEFLLVRFSDQVELLAGLTGEAEQVRRQLMSIQASGQTALLDAIELSVRQIQKAHNARKALMIISDGGDNHSRRTVSEIKSLVQESDVQIYALGIFDSMDMRAQTREELAGPDLLREVAKQSGGRLIEISDLSKLPTVAAKVSDALRTQYVLGYSPANSRLDGKFHRIEVKLVKPKGFPRLHAFWRQGYYAP